MANQKAVVNDSTSYSLENKKNIEFNYITPKNQKMIPFKVREIWK